MKIFQITIIIGLACIVEIIGRQPVKIKGGVKAAEGEYPYFVTVRYVVPPIRNKCGGTILNQRYILTAAHCVENKEASALTIFAGSTLYGMGTQYRIEKIIPYGHNTVKFENDIALLKTTDEIIFNDIVKPVTLPTENIQGFGYPVESVGFGRLAATSDFPYELRKISLMTEDQKRCMELTNIRNNRRFCTRNLLGEGLCYGDSGGPLVMNDVIIGVFIRMFPCGIGKPDMFTSVYAYRDWIKANIEGIFYRKSLQ